MNDNHCALFSACFYDLLEQAGFVLRAHGQTLAEGSSFSANGPENKGRPTRLDAPIHGLAVRGFGKRPDFRKSLAIQFP